MENMFIMARDTGGKLYTYGTNQRGLEKGDVERFRSCDLSRYPVGRMEGFSNQVVAIRTSIPIGVEEVITLFTTGSYRSKITGKPVTMKEIPE